MKWVLVLPPGDEAVTVVADVPAAQLVESDQFEAYAKYEAAARTLRELGIEPPPFRPEREPLEGTAWEIVGSSADDAQDAVADVVPIGQSFRTREKALACPCGAAWSYPVDAQGRPTDPEEARIMRGAHDSHRKRCGVSLNQRDMDGHAEPGEFMNGEDLTEGRPKYA